MARKWTKQQRAEQSRKSKARAAAKRFAAEGNAARALPPMSKKELELSQPIARDRVRALQVLMAARDVNAEQALSIMNRIMAAVLS